jgi:hypothetical protein
VLLELFSLPKIHLLLKILAYIYIYIFIAHSGHLSLKQEYKYHLIKHTHNLASFIKYTSLHVHPFNTHISLILTTHMHLHLYFFHVMHTYSHAGIKTYIQEFKTQALFVHFPLHPQPLTLQTHSHTLSL